MVFSGLGFSVSAVAGTDIPFLAEYDVTVDGKTRMETRISLKKEGDGWIMESNSRGTRGIAKFLKVNSSETSSGQWQNGRFRQSEFSHHGKVAGNDNRWTARFDWADQVVSTEHEDGHSELPISDDTHDPVSLTLAIRNLLANNDKNMVFEVVDEDEIDQHRYTAEPPVALETFLGCFQVIPVKRVRENSKRYSTGWYAEALEFIPVRIQHGKQGGKEFELRIRRLQLNGEEVSGPTECPS